MDIVNGKTKRGGPAHYCAMAAQAYGAHYACVGLKPRKYLWNVPKGWFFESDGPIFRHIYHGDHRKSILISKPAILDMCPVDLRKFDVIMISPVFREFSFELIEKISKNHFVVIDVQGFVRSTNEANEIIYVSPDQRIIQAFEHSQIVHISDEELSAIKKLPTNPIKVLTYGSDGSKIVHRQKSINIPAYKVEGDPTGAGDVFTTFLALEYFKKKDIISATIFASAATSLFIEGKLGYSLDEIVKISELKTEIRTREEKIRNFVSRKY